MCQCPDGSTDCYDTGDVGTDTFAGDTASDTLTVTYITTNTSKTGTLQR